MNLNRYLDEGILLDLYGRYFWNLELLKATQVISAYYNNEFVGILLARMKDEKPTYKSFLKNIYVKVFDVLQKVFAGKGVDSYDDANKEMLAEYSSKVKINGEIVFLASNPDIKIKGVGTKLLQEFEKREKGKQVYLYTDDACTYQFYDHRNFERVGEKNIELEIRGKIIPITCMLYAKKIPTDNNRNTDIVKKEEKNNIKKQQEKTRKIIKNDKDETER